MVNALLYVLITSLQFTPIRTKLLTWLILNFQAALRKLFPSNHNFTSLKLFLFFCHRSISCPALVPTSLSSEPTPALNVLLRESCWFSGYYGHPRLNCSEKVVPLKAREKLGHFSVPAFDNYRISSSLLFHCTPLRIKIFHE